MISRRYIQGPSAISMTWSLIVVPTLSVIMLWLPFGFSLGGLIEEWGVLALFTKQGANYIVGAGMFEGHRARPLTILPHAIAYQLDKDSFFYWHLIQMMSLIVKGVSASFIGLFLTRNYVFALIIGLLTLLFPADTMQFTFRGLHINCSIALALLSFAFILASFETKSPVSKFILAISACASFIIAALMYEAVAPLAVVPILALFVRHPFRQALTELRCNWKALSIWLVGLVGYGVFFISVVVGGSTYQTDLSQPLSASRILAIAEQTPDAVAASFHRAFYEAWYEAFSLALSVLDNYWLVGFLAVGTLVAVLPLSKAYIDHVNSEPVSVPAKLFAAGLVVFLLGYAPYLASTAHLYITQRTFLVSSLGASLSIVATMMILRKVIGTHGIVLFSTLLISLSFISQLYQHDRYNRLYADHVRPALNTIALSGAFWPGQGLTTIVNNSGSLTGTWDFGVPFQSAVEYLLGSEHRIVVCEGPNNRLLPLTYGPEDRRQKCQINNVAAAQEPTPSSGEQQRPAVLYWNKDGTISLGNQGEIHSVAPISDRAMRLLGLGRWTKADSLFGKLDRSDRFTCEFESMWGYAYPCRTYGFYDGAAAKTVTSRTSYAWAIERKAGLFFDLQPTASEYLISVELYYSMVPAEDVQFSLNGHSLQLSLKSERKLEARVSSQLFEPTVNRLEVDSPLDAKSGIAIGVDRITVTPLHRD